jgi:RNA polymerase sigma factor (TIGR02999 family)
MSEVTQILSAIEAGEPQAAERLLPLVYDELRTLAAARIAREKPGQTLDATALVHEAYLRLVRPVGREAAAWNGRGHFFAAAAEAMRRILVESARRKARHRHGGEFQRAVVEIDEVPLAGQTADDDVLAVDESLDALGQADSQAAEVVKLHFFLGLPFAEIATLLGISERTAYRNWSFARAWLAAYLDPKTP